MLLMLQKVAEKSVFDDVVQDVSGRCPSIDLPWLDVGIGLANIQQTVEKCAQPSYKCEQSADDRQSEELHLSADDDISTSSDVGCRQVTDYSHLYIYKKNATLPAAQSQTTAEYIALSSSSSDEDENDAPLADVLDVSHIHDMSVTVTDTAPTTSVHSRKYSKLYRSANTGVQIADPNKKRKKSKKRS